MSRSRWLLFAFVARAVAEEYETEFAPSPAPISTDGDDIGDDFFNERNGERYGWIGPLIVFISLPAAICKRIRLQQFAAAAKATEYGLTSSAPDALILSGHGESEYNGRYTRAGDLWNDRPHYVNEQGRQFYFTR